MEGDADFGLWFAVAIIIGSCVDGHFVGGGHFRCCGVDGRCGAGSADDDLF